MSPKPLLNDVEEVLRTVPPVETRRHPEPENKAWLGRAANVIQQWDSSRSVELGELVKRFHAPMAREAGEAFQQILVMLNQAQFDLHARARLLNLKDYRRKLLAQDEVIRSAAGREIPIGVSHTLINLFSEMAQAFPELNLRSFEGHGNGDFLRSQISIAVESLSSLTGDAVQPHDTAAGRQKPANSALVFVIHGRQLLGDFHDFLYALGLKPLEWSEARRRTGKPNPYTWEIVDLALKEAGAIVALMTPDDEARLLEHLWTSSENGLEKQLLSQPRQNVLFEAGVAYGRDPQRTVLIRVGAQRPMSDLSGHHILTLDNSPQSRQAIADALRAAGCPVDVSGSGWFESGDFTVPDRPVKSRGASDRIKQDAARLRLYKIQIKGFSELLDAANIVTSIHSFFYDKPEYLNEASGRFLEKYPLNFREQLAFNVQESMKKWTLEQLRADVDALDIE
jgi:predicted nucleotide-binding protein